MLARLFKPKQDPLSKATIEFLLENLLTKKNYESGQALDMAQTVAVTAAGITYNSPTTAQAVYLQEFGKKATQTYAEMADYLAKVVADQSIKLSEMNDLPFLKTPFENVERRGQGMPRSEVDMWNVIAFRLGVILGATQPDLFRQLLTNTPRPDSTPDDGDFSFDDCVAQAAAFIEVYESNVGPLSAT